jgi:acetolactate synthase I/II/III large subunit
MKIFEAVTTAVASEGFDHLFAVMGDANQDMMRPCPLHFLRDGLR